MTKSTRVALAGACVLFALAPLVGCSDDDDSAASSTISSSPAASTTANPSSTASPTTSSTTTSTTLAPTTTLDEVAAAKAAVVAAVPRTREVYNYAILNLGAPDALDVLAQAMVRDSPSWGLTIQNIETLRSNGWLARPNPEIADTSTVEGEPELLDGPPATKARVTVCTISAGVIYKPGGAPGGSDLIVNDEVVARRELITLALQDGAWKLQEGTGLGIWRGEATCPAA